MLKSPFDIISNDEDFKWLHRITDVQAGSTEELRAAMRETNANKVCITLGRGLCIFKCIYVNR